VDRSAAVGAYEGKGQRRVVDVGGGCKERKEKKERKERKRTNHQVFPILC
jgi:hypothetical protein